MKQKISEITFYLLLPMFLFSIGTIFLFSHLNGSEFGLLNLDVPGALEQLVIPRSTELLKGDIIKGKFHSQYNNLGILSVRFYNQDRDSNDILMFKLKEEGKNSWYYEAQYKTDQFLPHKLFTFGFPIITNSAGKNYEFQIESLMGATGSGIVVDNTQPVFVAKSSFTKEALITNKKQLFSFFGSKLFFLFGDREIRQTALIYFLPFILYIIYLISNGIGYQFLSGVVLFLAFCDIFWVLGNNDFLYVGVLFLWWLVCRRFRFESGIAAVLALTFLIISPILLLFHQNVFAEKSAIWAYLFLCAMVTQQLYEIKKHPKNLFTFKKFRNNIFKIELDKKNYFVRFVYRIYKPGFFLALFCLLIRSIQNLYAAFRIYRLFIPNDFIIKFLVETIFPYAILFFVFIIIFIKLKKYFNAPVILAFILTLLLNISSSLLISKLTKFRDFPTITSISPNNVFEAWADITVSGQNFQNKPFIGKVQINGVEQRIIDWTNTKVVFRTNPTTTKSGFLEILTNGKGKSNKYSFNYLFK